QTRHSVSLRFVFPYRLLSTLYSLPSISPPHLVTLSSHPQSPAVYLLFLPPAPYLEGVVDELAVLGQQGQGGQPGQRDACGPGGSGPPGEPRSGAARLNPPRSVGRGRFPSRLVVGHDL